MKRHCPVRSSMLVTACVLLLAVVGAACTDVSIRSATEPVALPVPVPGAGATPTTSPAQPVAVDPTTAAPDTTPARGPGGCVMAVPTATPVRSFPALPCMVIDKGSMYKATVATSLGTFTAVLDPKAAPVAVNNLYFLAQHHFYDGLVFHRVESWVIQTGDPRWGNSEPKSDDVGYTFADELPPAGYQYRPGDLLMANAGPDTNSSQWWVAPNEQAASLPLNYTLFGRVVEGLEVVTAISQVPTNPQNKYPVDPPVIISLTVEPL